MGKEKYSWKADAWNMKENYQKGSLMEVEACTMFLVGLSSQKTEELFGAADLETYSGTAAKSKDAEEYILPDSDRQYLTEEDLIKFDQDLLRLARNEIYARHGCIFNSADLNQFFQSCSWYHGTVASEQFDDSCFNVYEKRNIELFVKMETG